MKPLLYFLSIVLMLPVVLLYWIIILFRGRQGAFSGCSQLVSLIPGLLGVFLRWGFYKMVLPRCGRDAHIGFGTIFSHPTVSIGKSVYIGAYCIIGDVDLQDDCILASGVSVCNGTKQHRFDRLDVPIREQGGEYVRIVIGADSWIGERAVVMADVGAKAIVGAGSIVVKPVEEKTIVVGNPASPIGRRE